MSGAVMPWIAWFCKLKGNEYFCEVDPDFIKNETNLTGLSEKVSYYREALNVIMDIEQDEEKQKNLELVTKHLYGLIHARYIFTKDGLVKMLHKYRSGKFGTCTQLYCHHQPMLPIENYHRKPNLHQACSNLFLRHGQLRRRKI